MNTKIYMAHAIAVPDYLSQERGRDVWMDVWMDGWMDGRKGRIDNHGKFQGGGRALMFVASLKV